MTFGTNPLKCRSNQLQLLLKEIKAEVVTLNWAEVWILRGRAELWIGCMTAVGSGCPWDPGCPAKSPQAQGHGRGTGRLPEHLSLLPCRRHSQDTHLGNIPRPHQNTMTQTQPATIHSRAGQKNTAAKLSAPGFWTELQKVWHMDQSWMASPMQDSSTARFFYKTKL